MTKMSVCLSVNKNEIYAVCSMDEGERPTLQGGAKGRANE